MSARPELAQFPVAGCWRSLRGHRADAELLDHALPRHRVRAGIGEIGLVERERRAGRKRISRVVTTDAVLRHHRLIRDGNVRFRFRPVRKAGPTADDGVCGAGRAGPFGPASSRVLRRRRSWPRRTGSRPRRSPFSLLCALRRGRCGRWRQAHQLTKQLRDFLAARTASTTAAAPGAAARAGPRHRRAVCLPRHRAR